VTTLVTGVQTCALPIYNNDDDDNHNDRDSDVNK